MELKDIERLKFDELLVKCQIHKLHGKILEGEILANDTFLPKLFLTNNY